MKFTVIKDLKKDKIMKPILSSVLLFSILYIISDFFVKYNSFGITQEAVKLTVLGDEEQFLDPVDKNIFLEFWHIEIFSIMMVCFIISTIYIRLTKGSKTAVTVVNTILISSILSLILLPILYFYSAAFIYPYLITFYIWHILVLVAAFISLWKMYSE